MATRRTTNIEKDVLDKVDINASSSPAKLSTAPVVPKYVDTVPCRKSYIPELTCARSVVAKLLLFTLAMVVAPLGSYYITLNTIFKGVVKNPLFSDFPLEAYSHWESK